MPLLAPPTMTVTATIGTVTTDHYHATVDNVAAEIEQVKNISAFVRKAMAQCGLEKLEDNTWYAAIPGFDGVWANASAPLSAVKELESVLLDWLSLKLEDHDDDIPFIDGIDLRCF